MFLGLVRQKGQKMFHQTTWEKLRKTPQKTAKSPQKPANPEISLFWVVLNFFVFSKNHHGFWTRP